MKVLTLKMLLLVGLLGATAAAIGPGRVSAATLTVCPSGCAFSDIGSALAAAKNGDTIAIGAGTYQGGLAIDVSVKLAGAGAHNTIISGGGPVLSIGQAFADSEPTVSISGVTITGGVTNSSFLAPFIGNAIALGGGISVPPAAGFAPGATVSIANSVITDNTVAPTSVLDSGDPCPPDITITCINGDLPFAQAAGGGINTFGALTLMNTTVSNNQAGATGVASFVGPAGIFSFQGGLTLKNSTVTDNQAIASAPNGLVADSGGVAVNHGTLTIDNSRISDNSAVLDTAMPNDIPEGTAAHAGGIAIEGDDTCTAPDFGCAAATIRDSTISGNSARTTNSLGDATALCGGICDDGQLALSNSLVSDNTVSANVPAGLAACACAASGGIGADGLASISNTRITGNTVTASAPSGTATANSGGVSADHPNMSTISDSLISGNRLIAATTTGSASVRGAGLHTGALLTISDTTISGNTGTATGPSGTVQGGGIWNGNAGTLTLLDSRIIHNTLSGSPGVTIQGGGLFTTIPVTLTNTVIAQNIPDQCFGC